MASRLDDLRRHLAALEHDAESELRQAQERWHYRLEAGRVRFQRDARLLHRNLRQRVPAFIRESRPLNVLSAPIVYSLIVPVAILDVWVTAYQLVCFPLFGIGRVRRSTYVTIDRHHLSYLNVIEKLNCVFCGYANGVFAYTREVAGRTEQYWCPIKHATRVRGPHPHYHEFVDFGDARGYRQQLPRLRAELKPQRRAGEE
jgi:hypothetical protein